MKNPLNKRLPREFIHEFGKYLVIFIFMTLTIGFVSGFLVAGGSMIEAYNESFEKYNIENGHFLLQIKADSQTILAIEKEGVKIYPQFFVEKDVDDDADGKTDNTLRIFANRTDVNKICLMQGKLPEKENEIAIDRMYAENNGIAVGNKIKAGMKTLTVTGLVALSDYSALFSDNGDMMFDAVKFGVAVMSEKGFESFLESEKHFCYAWKYDEAPVDEIEEKEKADAFMKALAGLVPLSDYVPGYLNQAIHFTGDDLGGDRAMILVLLYILIGILAFVFSVTISHTIVKEATVIGTLRASGYTKGEILRHYLAIPMIVTLFAALIGNVLGYTIFKSVAAGLYYGSYSLPTYKTIWNGKAFILTTIVPLFIMLLTNVCILLYRLSFSPLRFIRRDLKRNTNKKAVRIPGFRFFTRFRLRIIMQNKSSYITLFIGIIFANILLLFGMMMVPLLSHYQDNVLKSMLAKYQYVLTVPKNVTEDSAEKYSYTGLEIEKKNGNSESISVYGIVGDSRYAKMDIPEEGICISDGFALKYQLKEGETVTLKEPYGEDSYTFTINAICEYTGALAVFMTEENFRDVFDLEDGFFNGYFSDKVLSELDEADITACITEEDLTKVSRQLNVSMGSMFQMLNVFAIILFALLIYLLTKLILERNTTSISMVKILGYRNGEIARLYLMATTWAVVLFIGISLLLATGVMDIIYVQIMQDYSGWLNFYIAPDIYIKMFLMGLGAYVLVALLQFKKIQKIPMDEALKNVE